MDESSNAKTRSKLQQKKQTFVIKCNHKAEENLCTNESNSSLSREPVIITQFTTENFFHIFIGDG